MLTSLLGLLAVVALTCGTALYVAAEFSLVAVERTQLEAAAKRATPVPGGCWRPSGPCRSSCPAHSSASP